MPTWYPFIILLFQMFYISNSEKLKENISLNNTNSTSKEKFLSKIICSKEEFVNRIQKLAKEPSKFKWFETNIYWDGQQWHSDCTGLLKGIFNGKDFDLKEPKNELFDFSNTGDVGANGIFNQCTNISSNFSELKKSEPRLIKMDGHLGTFLGKEVVIDNKIYNVIEGTPNWGGGIIYTYVDKDGNRLKHKGGEENGKWKLHGLPSKWVLYN